MRKVKVLKKIRIVLKEDEDGGFYIYSPDLRGCISQGETEEEAVRNYAEAIGLYLEVKAEMEQEAAQEEVMTNAEIAA